MSEVERSEDPEPSERVPAGPLLVPVRSGPALTVDPQFSAPGVSKDDGDEGSWRKWDPQHVGVLRVTGAAALVSCLHLLIG
ncbi:hypothetical protein [Streptomyces sp. NPDC058548]|uniref:hypothetical protein n=1 Tax=Streptomyces sp. NPDC058548 TaxID=3346545 RepID=UPI003656CF09